MGDDIRLVEPARLGVIVEEEDPAEAAKQVAALLGERLKELAADSGKPVASGPLPGMCPKLRRASGWWPRPHGLDCGG